MRKIYVDSLLIAKPPLHRKNAFSLDQGVEQILEIV